MNVYYSIDDLDLDDGPIIVNMIVERANGQQIVSSLAPDAVVERDELKAQLKDLESVKASNLQSAYELEECRRVRNEHYGNFNRVRDERDELKAQLKSVCEERDQLALEVLRHKLVCVKTPKEES